jgi:Tfp pilus assembly protein PilV
LQHPFKNDRGYLLLTTVLVLAFLSLAVFALGGLAAGAAHRRQEAEDAFKLVYLAQEKAESLKAAPFDQLASAPEADVPGWPGAKARVDVVQVNAWTKRVTVTVADEKGAAQALTFERTPGWF